MTAQPVREKIQKAEAEISAGRLWRAKEMFRGYIASPRYALEPELLEAYGRLLDQLGDRYEAGKYLFLSGRDASEYRQAVTLYLERNRRATVADLIARFPAAIRHHGLGHLPESVCQALQEKGADPAELARLEPPSYTVRTPTWKVWVATTAFVGVSLFALFLMIVGSITAITWIL